MQLLVDLLAKILVAALAKVIGEFVIKVKTDADFRAKVAEVVKKSVDAKTDEELYNAAADIQNILARK